MLKLLRSQGMNSDHLDQVTHALIISHMHYALPAWCGFLTTDLRNKIEGLLKILKRSGYLKEHICFFQIYALMDLVQPEVAPFDLPTPNIPP